MRPVLGKVLTKAIASDAMSFKADTLQNVVKSKEYEENKEYGMYEFQ